jgi:hypothetical protein
MRSRSLVLLLALAGTALSGCASGFDTAFTQSSIPGVGGTNGTDTGGNGISGDTNGTGEQNEVNLASGDTTLAYTSGARSIDGSGNTQLVISSAGTSAQVSVDPGSAMGFTGTTTMARYLTQTGAATAPEGFNNPADPAAYYPFDNANYSEYRRITSTSDAELQVWNFTDSNGQNNYAAHFREAKKGQSAWFFGGSAGTDSAETDQLVANGTTVNYTGNYAGAATTAGWGDANQYQSGDGQWRMNGTAQMSANFGTGQFAGTLTPRYWESYQNGQLIQIDVGTPGDGNEVVTTVDGIRDARPALALDIKTYHTSTLELAGTITGNRLTGTTNIVSPGATVTNNPDGSRTVDNNLFVNGDRALQGGFYGTNAEQVTGVFATYGVLPEPTGADTGINDDRRATIDIQGVFHGQ